MPFDPAPQPTETDAPVRRGRFQHLADAMLRGAAITPLAIGIRCDAHGGTCALGAMHLGLGVPLEDLNERFLSDEELSMHNAYKDRYGEYLHMHSNTREFTREQIAERIAAL